MSLLFASVADGKKNFVISARNVAICAFYETSFKLPTLLATAKHRFKPFRDDLLEVMLSETSFTFNTVGEVFDMFIIV